MTEEQGKNPSSVFRNKAGREPAFRDNEEAKRKPSL